MNTILLRPTDVLFFRDGRPMSGSLSGHGAAWPLPTVVNHAFHAALHRADLEKIVGFTPHKHVPGRSSEKRDFGTENREQNGRLFGSLSTAGPFPVDPAGSWHFPRPLDAGLSHSAVPTFAPLMVDFREAKSSSLPAPLRHPVANTRTASKDTPEPWLTAAAYAVYLSGEKGEIPSGNFLRDSAFSDSEFTFGIAIDPVTGTQDGEGFYSASYLRLREGWHLGVLAEAPDKGKGGADIIPDLLGSEGATIIAGGQQRVCTATLENPRESLPLPTGRTDSHRHSEEEFLLKWTLLTPAIFPEIGEVDMHGNPLTPHGGGWLPSWIRQEDGAVMLKSGDSSRRENERRDPWRERIRKLEPIPATLVAAMTGKPVPVTGYALPNPADPARAKGGAKSTHLAVPAGSVYYFSCPSAEVATALAHALNWHGSGPPATLRNRRSTLLGEQGFGLGVCSPWRYHDGKRPE